MARIYTAQFNSLAITAQQDLFEIVAGAASNVIIHELFLSQLTNVSDANEKELLILLKQGQTTTGSGGAAPTKLPRDFNDSAAAATVAANNTVKASVGTIVTHCVWSWNVRMPLQILFTPEMRPFLPGGRRMTFELGTTPSASMTTNGYVTWQEGN